MQNINNWDIKKMHHHITVLALPLQLVGVLIVIYSTELVTWR